MKKNIVALVSLILLASCATAPQLSPAARAELASSGKLRVGINFQNVLLASKDPAGGEARGVAVDVARELARRLDVPIEIVAYDTPGAMAAAAKTGAWDVAFFAVDPTRAGEITFSTPYLDIEATYLVPAGSPLRTIADVDRNGVRIAVAAKSAYDLYLSRNLQHARVLRAPTVGAAVDLFVADKLDALADLKPRLVTTAEKLPGSRVLEGRFSVTEQAIGTPKGRDAAAKYLTEFVEDAKATGLVAQAIEKNGARGLSVAPRASVK